MGKRQRRREREAREQLLQQNPVPSGNDVVVHAGVATATAGPETPDEEE